MVPKKKVFREGEKDIGREKKDIEIVETNDYECVRKIIILFI